MEVADIGWPSLRSLARPLIGNLRMCTIVHHSLYKKTRASHTWCKYIGRACDPSNFKDCALCVLVQ
jgi:hypothetical protein